uniref:Uncharacterized protein n=1 Tax=Salvator merianae TaxID=96440 RepID=A0A8D0BJ89_SALMN
MAQEVEAADKLGDLLEALIAKHTQMKTVMLTFFREALQLKMSRAKVQIHTSTYPSKCEFTNVHSHTPTYCCRWYCLLLA